MNCRKVFFPPSLLRLENKLLAALLYHKHCQAAEQGMTIHFHIADPMCCCRASEFELVDAVGILVDNALEASSPGDNIYVSIHASHHNGTEGIKIVVDNPGETVNDAISRTNIEKGIYDQNRRGGKTRAWAFHPAKHCEKAQWRADDLKRAPRRTAVHLLYLTPVNSSLSPATSRRMSIFPNVSSVSSE